MITGTKQNFRTPESQETMILLHVYWSKETQRREGTCSFFESCFGKQNWI